MGYNVFEETGLLSCEIGQILNHTAYKIQRDFSYETVFRNDQRNPRRWIEIKRVGSENVTSLSTKSPII